MKVMIDTNVLISAIYSPSSYPAKVVRYAADHHTIVLCNHIIQECQYIFEKKFPSDTPVLLKLLSSIDYQLADESQRSCFLISDLKDQPILNAACSAKVDMLVTGDKHFSNLDIPNMQILTPHEFCRFHSL